MLLRNLATGGETEEHYDRLLLSPGAEAVRPKLTGIDSKRIFTLRNIPDLDKVMAALIIANGALAMGKPVSLFFTFWGLNVLRRPDAPSLKKSIVESAFGVMLPKGAGRSRSRAKMNFAGMGAARMKHVMAEKRVATPAQRLTDPVEGGAQIIACQMPMDVMGIRKGELIDGVELGGVAAFLGEAQESATTLFI